MKVITLYTQYNLIEFHYYIDEVETGEIVSVLELLIKSNDIDTIEENFSKIFAIETDSQSYIFSHYSVSEYYEVDDCIKVICVK